MINTVAYRSQVRPLQGGIIREPFPPQESGARVRAVVMATRNLLNLSISGFLFFRVLRAAPRTAPAA